MAEILLVGNYRPVLRSRSALLQQTCSQTFCADENEILKFASQNVDLVILCHSIHVERRSALCKAIRDTWTGIRILQVVTRREDTTATLVYADAAARSLDPDELIATTARLLGMPSARCPEQSPASPASAAS
jgi:DNA-binding response OmpR family regulator